MLGKLFIDKDIEVCVISAGGVGTTFLMEFLSKYKKLNNPYDYDDIKHLPLPPLSKNKNLVQRPYPIFARYSKFNYLQIH